MSTGQSAHILVVDDDSGVAETLADMLDTLGYRVTVAKDGASMDDLLKSGTPITALLVDFLLNGERSIPLVRRAQDHPLPVIVCSGTPEGIEFAMKHGLQFLPKPFRFRDLQEVVGRAVSSAVYEHKDGASQSTTESSREMEE